MTSIFVEQWKTDEFIGELFLRISSARVIGYIWLSRSYHMADSMTEGYIILVEEVYKRNALSCTRLS